MSAHKINSRSAFTFILCLHVKWTKTLMGCYLTLQTYHVDFTLKRCGNGRFHVVSTWNPRGVFAGEVLFPNTDIFYAVYVAEWRSMAHFYFWTQTWNAVCKYREKDFWESTIDVLVIIWKNRRKPSAVISISKFMTFTQMMNIMTNIFWISVIALFVWIFCGGHTNIQISSL